MAIATLPSNQLMNAWFTEGSSAAIVHTTLPVLASSARSLPSPEPK